MSYKADKRELLCIIDQHVEQESVPTAHKPVR